MPPRPRRSYDQFCAAARALDAVGDRWTLLIVRELLLGPRRYTDLHADLPGVSTDVLASRLKDLEQSGLATRRRLPPPASAYVYELTGRGRELTPVLRALAAWGAPELAERRPTDAVRAHWFALPLLDAVALEEGLVELSLEEGDFHVRMGGDGAVVSYGDGPAPDEPDARVTLDAVTAVELGRGTLSVADGVRDGRIAVTGDGPLAKALRNG
ncbi:winged helix-turn-helix transcriptional regulator [Streptomyces spectabilis]|uniref:Transcriptional regulator n=1 Tax=Streptomyces spectabilis TaxID=68270 RepID=A0A5P2XIM1_STRST|nr:helix-turn-helix domain-containing protein [Streptomyces spectabilis]MBB5105239.1 DNA-binding HxlR family transcriptional regulator [Streptomyces spectabilis]MCI3905964.1 helix-turn-helix transcriptional regulator [Streptomyces spectabilis]QEV62870.1 transcriptional regulator [Streptomyces spectabilis]GGV05647.1 transcriptional regulator [Streptomyces spectabilis]